MVSMDNVDQLGVLLYGACTGIRSSRQIERRCHEDIAFRVLSGNRAPDHLTSPGSGSARNKPWHRADDPVVEAVRGGRDGPFGPPALAAGGLLAVLTNSLMPFAFERGKELAGVATVVGFCLTMLNT